MSDLLETYPGMSYQVPDYETFVGLLLLKDRQEYRKCNRIMVGTQAANGSGRIPLSWFLALTDSLEEAIKIHAEVNMDRLAKKVWGRS